MITTDEPMSDHSRADEEWLARETRDSDPRVAALVRALGQIKRLSYEKEETGWTWKDIATTQAAIASVALAELAEDLDR
jgi:hypothetical protein